MSPAFPDSRAWPEHHRIAGFEVITALREGDTGITYRAWDHALARPVMLEEFLPAALAQRGPDGFMLPALPATAPMLERAGRLFIDEARVLARAEHPSLARVLHVVEAHGTAFRVMPGYAGTPLSDLLARGEAPRDEAQLRRLIGDLLGALDAWHAIAGPHGGVRPAQILWLDSGQALLLGPDAASHTPLGSGTPTGTPGAEPGLLGGGQAPGAAQGMADDLHALAQVARACIAGNAPGGAARPLQATLEAARQHALEHGDEAPPSYGAPLLQALDAALSPDPLRRPANAAQFRQWLDRGTGAAAAGARPAPSPAPVPVPAPAPSPAEPSRAAPAPARDDDEVDAATSALIRAVVGTIPDRPETAPRARQPEPAPGTAAGPREPLFDDRAPERIEPREPVPPFEPIETARKPVTARARQRLVGAVMVLALLVVAGLALRQQFWPLRDQVAQARSTDAQRPDANTAPMGLPTPAPAPAPTPAVPTQPAPTADAPAPPTSVPMPPPPPREFIEAPPPAPAAAPMPTPEAAPAAEAPAPERRATAARAQPPPQRQAPRNMPEPVTISPRQQCGGRTEFALYRCMQQQCDQTRWRGHPQCTLLRQTDRVPG